ncbi:(2Fe-2S)-binding protein [Cryobacterium arcticum]|uniref:BFD-like [2Fe-2S]-binding domain-containing protein n=1 Tax=Cryobacterium arcticum TaxID=670052 RepID=A0A317ZUA1_9MICO|nr:hypothetical protein CTB96_07045 [Cryobacterium arcticum]
MPGRSQYSTRSPRAWGSGRRFRRSRAGGQPGNRRHPARHLVLVPLRRRPAREAGNDTVACVGAATRAGNGCGGCKGRIGEVLERFAAQSVP